MINKFITGLKPDQRKMMAIVSVVAIVGLFGGLFLYPAWKNSNRIDQLIGKEQETIRQNTRFLAKREKAIKEAAVFKDYYSKEVRAEEQVIADFSKQVDQLAGKSGVQTLKTSTLDKVDRNDYLQYFISMECSGTLENLTNFIYAIDNFPELTKVEKMNLASNAKTANTIQASLIISKMIISADPSIEAKKLVIVKPGKEAAKPAAIPKE